MVERVMAGLENGGKKDIEEEKAKEGEEIEEEKTDDEIKPDWQGVPADRAVTLVVFNKWDKYFTSAIKQHSVPITNYEQCSSAFDHINFLAGLFDKERPSGQLVFEGVSAFN